MSMNEDITFCGYGDCPNKDCERHISHIKNPHILHSYAYFPKCEYFVNEVKPTDIMHIMQSKADILQELPQYHFGRDTFVSTFEQVFTNDEILDLEVMCHKDTALKEFLLFYHPDFEEFYIIHLPSGTIINWYKHLGRTNTCNKENFTIADLKKMLEMLKADIKGNKNDG